MAPRQDLNAGGESNRLSKQILGLAAGAALGLLAYYGACTTLRWFERSGSSKKPPEIGMSAPPTHKVKETSKGSQSYASASKESKESQHDGASASQDHDDKDGKNKRKESSAAEASHATKSTIVQDEKIPEPGFDAPEDKMQDIGMSWRDSGSEVIIEALCPKELQSKDLKCTFTTSTLVLEVAGKEIATGKLYAPIKPDESTWQFGDEHLKNPQADSKSLTVTLVKGSRKPWKDLFLVAGAHGLE